MKYKYTSKDNQGNEFSSEFEAASLVDPLLAMAGAMMETENTHPGQRVVSITFEEVE